jgi:hypothetical protein
MMLEDGLKVPCHVTTNGTQYNARIERILEHIPMRFAVSIDGCTKETVESIRVNANFESLIENAKRFRTYAKEKGTHFGLTFCLMRQNWHEFGDYCVMADEWDCPVTVNTVMYPPQFGIYTLPMPQLRQVLDGLLAQAPRLDRALTRNRDIWFGEVERLEAFCREPQPA